MSNSRTQHPLRLRTRGLTKRFGGLTALDQFNLDIRGGEIVALIGPNGAGKTTLFNVLTGFLRADSGTIEFDGKPVHKVVPHRVLGHGVARTFQGLRLIGRITALENVLLSYTRQRGEHLGWLFAMPRTVSLQELKNRDEAFGLLERVGLAEKAGDLASQLSYGQQKLLTMACVLATAAGVLLLDEPVAGVHPRIIERILVLLRELAGAGKAILLIEHNMRAVEGVAERVVFMDEGCKLAEGTPAEVLRNERVLEAYLK
ncbi:ABC transporter ATP-binding protein [bacterium]|nr:ABC transporter ATP-binding protein [bacterium]